MTGQEIIAVVGVANTGVIGRDGDIPWHSPSDMRHFRALTTGYPIIMGRRTFESLPKLLPNRHHVVLTRSNPEPMTGVTFVSSREAALRLLAEEPKIMVIGGEEIYRQFYPDLTAIELTHLQVEVEGDAFFALAPSRDWKIVSEHKQFDEKLNAEIVFRRYEPDTSPNKYLTTDVKGLLRMFGAGEAVPGSGAAAALQALLAGYMCLTVIAKSREKLTASPHVRTFAQYAFRISAGIIPRLRDLFLRDIAVFEGVIETRRRRDIASGAEKARLSREHNTIMIDATEIPDQIFALSQELREMADFLFWNGWISIRGDSGAAVSSAAAAMMSATFVMSLNLRTMGSSAAALEWKGTIDRRHRECLALIARLPALINQTRDEEIENQPFFPGMAGEL